MSRLRVEWWFWFLVFSLSPACTKSIQTPKPLVIAYPVSQIQEWQFDPSLANREVDLKMLHFLYRGLFTPSHSLQMEPDTAKNYSIDGHVLKITIHSEIYWSDGVLLTVEHYRDGILRSLNQPKPSGASLDFKNIFSDECQKTKEWARCVTVSQNELILKFRIAGDLALPYLSHPMAFPERLDIINKLPQKPYAAPKNYPSLGPYIPTLIQKNSIQFMPVSPELTPVKIQQVLPGDISIEDIKIGKFHIIEPPAIPWMNSEFVLNHIYSFPEFNLIALIENLDPNDRSLFEATDPKIIGQYIQNKGLPISLPPKEIAEWMQICTHMRPKMLIIGTQIQKESRISLFGPNSLFAIWASESIQSQITQNRLTKIDFIPLSDSVLAGYVLYQKPKHLLYLFRSVIPSPIPILNVFGLEQGRQSAADQRVSFYNFLYHSYLESPGNQRDKIRKDILKYLCIESHKMFPLFSMPGYAFIHPQVSHFERKGNGAYIEIVTK